MVLIEYVPPGLFDPEQTRVFCRTCPTMKCLMTKALRVRLSKIVSTTKPIGDVVGDCAEGTKGKAAPENPEEQRLMRAFEKVLVE